MLRSLSATMLRDYSFFRLDLDDSQGAIAVTGSVLTRFAAIEAQVIIPSPLLFFKRQRATLATEIHSVPSFTRGALSNGNGVGSGGGRRGRGVRRPMGRDKRLFAREQRTGARKGGEVVGFDRLRFEFQESLAESVVGRGLIDIKEEPPRLVVDREEELGVKSFFGRDACHARKSFKLCE